MLGIREHLSSRGSGLVGKIRSYEHVDVLVVNLRYTALLSESKQCELGQQASYANPAASIVTMAAALHLRVVVLRSDLSLVLVMVSLHFQLRV